MWRKKNEPQTPSHKQKSMAKMARLLFVISALLTAASSLASGQTGRRFPARVAFASKMKRTTPPKESRRSAGAGCGSSCQHVKINIGPLRSSSFSSGEDQSPSISTKKNEWKEQLMKISNIASILCVLDCTILPAITLLLPLVGVAASAEQAKWLHEIGHQIALYFVMPVGGLTATLNYSSHKKGPLGLLAALGLSLIYAANGHGGPIMSRLPHDIAHSLHCGSWLHRTTNIIGCACLLGSNYLSHKISGCSHKQLGGSCDHNH